MNQPDYVQNRQMIALIITFFISILIIKLKAFIILPWLSIFILSLGVLTFEPLIHKRFHFSYSLHSLIFIGPPLLSVLFIPITTFKNIGYLHHSLIVVFFALFILLLTIMTIKKDLGLFNSPTTLQKIGLREFLLEILLMILGISGEELLFRALFFECFSSLSYIFTVFVSSITFTLIHYLNRWSKTSFTVRNYIFQFLLGFSLMSIFWITRSFWMILSLHIIFDYPFFVVQIKKLLAKEQPISFFDDY